MNKVQIEKGIKCCAEFLCGECPYRIYEDPTKEYSMRCIHKLIIDINDLHFKEKEK